MNIPTEWKITTLGDVCQVVPGYAFSSKDWKDNGIPVIRIKNIQDDRTVDTKNCAFVSQTIMTEKLNKYILKDGDIVIAMTGATAGKVGRIRANRQFLLNQRVAKLIPTKAEYGYLWPLLSSEDYRRCFFSLADGAAQPNMSGNQIESIEIPLPPISIQRKISAVFSAYDKLIENNTRRIKILEDMAQRIYREWFVHFRYPGHENQKLVDSELGMIPEGWEVCKTEEVMEIIGGGTPSTKLDEYWDNGTIDWFTPSDLTKSHTMFMLGSEKKITKLGLEKSSAKLFPPFSVMLTSRATIGEVSINTTPACTNQGFITCIPSDRLSTYQIYYWMLENVDLFKKLASGATFKELIKSIFRNFVIAVPPPAVVEVFNDNISPIAKNILLLHKKQMLLKKTRDLLLPKLISGQIDVADLDIDTGEVA